MSLATRKNTRKTAPAMGLATAVSERVDIDSIRLIGLSSRFSGFDRSLPEQVCTSVANKSRVEAKDSSLLVYISFRLRAESEPSGEVPADEFVYIEADFSIKYSITSLEGLTQRHLNAFAELNGVFNAWPYWRELVQSLTVRMGLPALTVPALKIGIGSGRRKSGSSKAHSRKGKKS